MYPQNLHTHGILVDGNDHYEDIVKKAIDIGFKSIGFSEHVYTAYCTLLEMSRNTIPTYKKIVEGLKEKYKGIIDVFVGIEFDAYSDEPQEGYDYIIGSLHYLKYNGEYLDFDRKGEHVDEIIKQHFNGNGLEFAKRYYKELCDLPNYGKFDIVGHFDIITKTNEALKHFDTTDPEYKKSAIEAVHALAEKIDVFELNTGAIARGYRSTAYPEPFILKEILKLNKQVIISSDCHNKDFLNYGFDDAEKLLKTIGFKNTVIFNGKTFTQNPL